MHTISIIGNANVGKSTLFNRFVASSQKAITSDYAGVTRDYKIADGKLFDLKFKLVDTAGLSSKICSGEDLKGKTDKQTIIAISKSDLILFVVDGTLGITPQDKSIASWLKKRNLPVIVVVNKIDRKQASNNFYEFHQLGYKTLCSVSAEHGLGFDGLYESICDVVEDSLNEDSEQEEDKSLKIAIIGKPNVGKSTLINSFLNEERLITSKEEGTTRDSIFVDINYKNNNIQLIDTAGMRRRSKIEDKIEKLSVSKSIEAIKICDIAILLTNADDILTKQELKLANIAIQDEFKPLIVAVNKIDLININPKFVDDISHTVARKLSQLTNAKVIYISALKKKNINKILDKSIALNKLCNIKISTSKLNKWLAQAIEAHQPPLSKLGRRIKIKFISQIGSSPPVFQIFSNHTKEIPDHYLKYLTNSLQDYFKLHSVPTRIYKVKPKNPYI
ncbi:MAG: ribosome biogenesis GTPase Der [Rickettsiales bacterium]|nr:ribosome biogenesis GTPase Der [Rickettsiales bacterium]